MCLAHSVEEDGQVGLGDQNRSEQQLFVAAPLVTVAGTEPEHADKLHEVAYAPQVAQFARYEEGSGRMTAEIDDDLNTPAGEPTTQYVTEYMKPGATDSTKPAILPLQPLADRVLNAPLQFLGFPGFNPNALPGAAVFVRAVPSLAASNTAKKDLPRLPAVAEEREECWSEYDEGVIPEEYPPGNDEHIKDNSARDNILDTSVKDTRVKDTFQSQATHSQHQHGCTENRTSFVKERTQTGSGQGTYSPHYRARAGTGASDIHGRNDQRGSEGGANGSGPREGDGGGHEAVGVGRTATIRGNVPEWLQTFTTSDRFFTPCPRCSPYHSGRDALVTFFDLDMPQQPLCSFCKGRFGPKRRQLQVRRSTYHDVVKVSDITRLTDISDVQTYVINGSKVVFLAPRPQPRRPKGVTMPAVCVMDGRQLMDYGSLYCSLRCKVEATVGVPPQFAPLHAPHAAHTPRGGQHTGKHVVSAAGVATTPRTAASTSSGGGGSAGGVGQKRRNELAQLLEDSGGRDVGHRDAVIPSWGVRVKRLNRDFNPGLPSGGGVASGPTTPDSAAAAAATGATPAALTPWQLKSSDALGGTTTPTLTPSSGCSSLQANHHYHTQLPPGALPKPQHSEDMRQQHRHMSRHTWQQRGISGTPRPSWRKRKPDTPTRAPVY